MPDLKQVPENQRSEYTVEVIKDYYGVVDPTYLEKKDPRYHYRFIREDTENIQKKTSNMLLQHGGWQFCSRDHLLRIGVKERQISPDGLYRCAGGILAFMPVELYEEKEKCKAKRANSPIKMVDRLLKKGRPEVGGADIHPSMKGIQTKEDLNFK